MQNRKYGILNAAIIGGGIAGLTCANVLKTAGYGVKIFEKSRGVGGRTPTRRSDEFRYDHGAPSFTAKTSSFIDFLTSVTKKHAVYQDENGNWIGRPGMNAIAKHLAVDLDIKPQIRIAHINDKHVIDENGQKYGPYDFIVCSAPAPQAADLFDDIRPHAERVLYRPFQSLMITFKDNINIDWSGYNWIEQAISSASKIDRPTHNSWTLHTTQEWSMRHIDLSKDHAARMMLELLKINHAYILHYAGHRWLYGTPDTSLSDTHIMSVNVGFCGDWFCGDNYDGVESAYLSGQALAKAILDT